MGKPFRFSIAAMLGVVAFAGLTARVVAVLVPLWQDAFAIVLFFGCFAAGGAAVGSAMERPVIGTLAGIFVAILFIVGVVALDRAMMHAGD